MNRISDLCEELEGLDRRFSELVQSNLRSSGVDWRAGKQRQGHSLVTTGGRILTIANDLCASLSKENIQSIKEYVAHLSACKRRCDESGIGISGMMKMLDKHR